MPRIRTSSSTPETRRRELILLKSSSIDGRIKLALDEAKTVVRNSIQYDNQQRLSYAEQFTQCDILESNDVIECTTILPPIHRVSTTLLSINDDDKHHARISSTIEGFVDQNKLLSSSSSMYHVELASSDEDDGQYRPHFITCFNIEPNYTFIHTGRRRTSSLPSSSIILNLSNSSTMDNHRSSSLVNLTLWQNNPQKIINLFDRQYHCQPISKFYENKFLLANSTHIDVYNIQTGLCEEKICFQ